MKNSPRESDDSVVLYEAEDGSLKISVHLDQETVWLNQQQLAELFRTEKQPVSYHLKNIFDE